jgi:hypothetical protein
MAYIFIKNHPILTFEYEPFINKYWNVGLSEFLISRYGNITTYEHDEVEEILLSCFEYFADKFRTLIMQQDTKIFFHYVFLLHEASIDLYIEQLGGLQLPDNIDANLYC